MPQFPGFHQQQYRGGSFHSLPMHGMPQGSGGYQIVMPTINSYNFHNSHVQLNTTPYEQRAPEKDSISGPFINDHLNLMNSINQHKKEQQQQQQSPTPAAKSFLPSFNPNIQSGESFGGVRSMNLADMFKRSGVFDQSMSMELKRGGPAPPEASSNKKNPFFPGAPGAGGPSALSN